MCLFHVYMCLWNLRVSLRVKHCQKYLMKQVKHGPSFIPPPQTLPNPPHITTTPQKVCAPKSDNVRGL